MARSKKKEGKLSKANKSFEERMWKVKEEEEEIFEEARKAWETRKKLGLLSKITDEDMQRQIV